MAEESKKGIVYIVKNPAFPHLLKIGYTGKGTIEDRGLNMSNVPEDFQVLFGYECNNPKEVEEYFHKRFKDFRHYSKTGRKTEFFYIGCLSEAEEMLKLLKGAKEISGEDILLSGSDEEYDDTKDIEEIAKRKTPFTFDMVNIKLDTILIFTEDEREECTVKSNRTVLYENKEYYLSNLAKKLMEKLGSSNEAYQGPKFFKVKGEKETLNEKRERMEKE